MFAAFSKYDVDGSGTMESLELADLLRKELNEPVTSTELEDAVRDMDADGNGVIDFEEFLDWFTSDSIRGRKGSLLLKTLRFKLRVQAKLRRTAESASRAIGKAMKAAKEKSAAVGAKIAKAAKRTSAAVARAKSRIYKKLPKKIRAMYEAPPRIPNTSVGPIDMKDFDRLQQVFLRWCKETFLLDIPYHGFLNTKKAKDAFEEVFIPRWNNGELDIWHYHDGREFELNGEQWIQTWDADNGRFEYREWDSSKKEILYPGDEALFVDPLKVANCRPAALKAFEKYDADGSGTLGPDEVKKLLNSELCTPIRGQTLEGFMEEVDEDKNGVVDFEEFLQWYARETDENGVNAIWARSLKTKTKKALLQSRKRLRNSGKDLMAYSRRTISRLKTKILDKLASKELLHLYKELGYPRDMSQKALSMHNADVEKAIAWLQSKGIEAKPPETKTGAGSSPVDTFSSEEDDY